MKHSAPNGKRAPLKMFGDETPRVIPRIAEIPG